MMTIDGLQCMYGHGPSIIRPKAYFSSDSSKSRATLPEESDKPLSFPSQGTLKYKSRIILTECVTQRNFELFENDPRSFV